MVTQSYVDHGYTLTQCLAEYAVELPGEDIPQNVLDAATNAVVDTVACGLRGASLEPAQAVKRAVSIPPFPGKFVCFDGSRVQSEVQAAYINATAAHSLELDDTDAAGLTHPGAVVVPAVLAASQELNVSGRALLEAVVVGYDVAMRTARWVNPKHRMRGFHTTATVTALGAVAAVSRLRGISAALCSSAMGIALSYAGGSFEFATDGANLKRVHAGKSSSTAIQACDLAVAGVEGPPTALDGPNGFYASSVGGEQFSMALGNLGQTFLIEEVGTKRHPCCRFCHTAIDAAIKLRQQGAPLHTDTDIEVVVSSLCHQQTGNTEPQNELQRQFSTPYGVALGLLQGETKLSDYQSAPNGDALALAKRIRMVTDDELEPRDRQATIRIHATSATYEETLDEPRGEASTPFTPQERFEKFNSLVSDLPIDADHLYKSLHKIQELPEVDLITELFDFPAAPNLCKPREGY